MAGRLKTSTEQLLLVNNKWEKFDSIILLWYLNILFQTIKH